MRKLILLSIVLILSACTDPKAVAKYAKMEGWDSYEVTGYAFIGCGKDDGFATGFKAKKNGVEFTGVVCSGLFKGSTLRLD